MQKKILLIKEEVESEFSVKEDGSLYFRDRLCVLADSELKKELLHEAHNSVFTMNLGGNKMYQDLKHNYWWKGMKRDVTDYVYKCLTCQQVKVEHQVPSVLLNPIPNQQWKWDNIVMDFVSGLPLT